MDLKSANFWRAALAEKAASCPRTLRIMEVCGTHTHAIARHNLRALLPENVTLISGPRCPVCVAGAGFIEKIRNLLRQGVIVTLFGDLLRIPGKHGTLAGENNLKIVYSPADALAFALASPRLKVVFAAVGFAPTLSAAAALMADLEMRNCDNFSLLSDFKEIKPVLSTLCCSSHLSALLLPGHVASVTGVGDFSGLPVPVVVSGFEPENILHSLYLLLEAVAKGKKDFLCNNYSQAVSPHGNQAALKLIDRYFTTSSSVWRGLGEIPGSGRVLKEEFARFDASKLYSAGDAVFEEDPDCRCGEIISGAALPSSCPLFGNRCTPENPVGACMASSEGSCAASFMYGGRL